MTLSPAAQAEIASLQSGIASARQELATYQAAGITPGIRSSQLTESIGAAEGRIAQLQLLERPRTELEADLAARQVVLSSGDPTRAVLGLESAYPLRAKNISYYESQVGAYKEQTAQIAARVQQLRAAEGIATTAIEIPDAQVPYIAPYQNVSKQSSGGASTGIFQAGQNWSTGRFETYSPKTNIYTSTTKGGTTYVADLETGRIATTSPGGSVATAVKLLDQTAAKPVPSPTQREVENLFGVKARPWETTREALTINEATGKPYVLAPQPGTEQNYITRFSAKSTAIRGTSTDTLSQIFQQGKYAPVISTVSTPTKEGLKVTGELSQTILFRNKPLAAGELQATKQRVSTVSPELASRILKGTAIEKQLIRREKNVANVFGAIEQPSSQIKDRSSQFFFQKKTGEIIPAAKLPGVPTTLGILGGIGEIGSDFIGAPLRTIKGTLESTQTVRQITPFFKTVPVILSGRELVSSVKKQESRQNIEINLGTFSKSIKDLPAEVKSSQEIKFVRPEVSTQDLLVTASFPVFGAVSSVSPPVAAGIGRVLGYGFTGYEAGKFVVDPSAKQFGRTIGAAALAAPIIKQDVTRAYGRYQQAKAIRLEPEPQVISAEAKGSKVTYDIEKGIARTDARSEIRIAAGKQISKFETQSQILDNTLTNRFAGDITYTQTQNAKIISKGFGTTEGITLTKGKTSYATGQFELFDTRVPTGLKTAQRSIFEAQAKQLPVTGELPRYGTQIGTYSSPEGLVSFGKVKSVTGFTTKGSKLIPTKVSTYKTAPEGKLDEVSLLYREVTPKNRPSLTKQFGVDTKVGIQKRGAIKGYEQISTDVYAPSESTTKRILPEFSIGGKQFIPKAPSKFEVGVTKTVLSTDKTLTGFKYQPFDKAPKGFFEPTTPAIYQAKTPTFDFEVVQATNKLPLSKFVNRVPSPKTRTVVLDQVSGEGVRFPQGEYVPISKPVTETYYQSLSIGKTPTQGFGVRSPIYQGLRDAAAGKDVNVLGQVQKQQAARVTRATKVENQLGLFKPSTKAPSSPSGLIFAQPKVQTPKTTIIGQQATESSAKQAFVNIVKGQRVETIKQTFAPLTGYTSSTKYPLILPQEERRRELPRYSLNNIYKPATKTEATILTRPSQDTGLKSISKTVFTPERAVTPKTNVRDLLKPATKQRPAVVTKQDTALIPKISYKTEVTPKQDITQITTDIFTTPPPPPPVRTFTFPPPPPVPKGGGFGLFGGGGFSQGRGTRVKSAKRGYRYTPTLDAALFGIKTRTKGKKGRKATTKGYLKPRYVTGFELRPI